jgi:hypothetical protein
MRETLLRSHHGDCSLFCSGQTGISKTLLDGQRQGLELKLIAKPMRPLKVIEHLKRT